MMEFETEAQQACYKKLLGWMDELFGDEYPWEKLNEPGFGLCLGSAWVEVRVHPWQEDDAVIRVCSKVVAGARVTPELQAFLLQKNAEMTFGAFAMSEGGDVFFGHTIVGSTCDPGELEASAIAVLETADEYDDKIVAIWGGERALDRLP